MSRELPGLDRIRARFIHLLIERQAEIAQHALLAWESNDAVAKIENLQAARNIVHQISGTAGSLGFWELGQAARECEELIIKHLENTPSADTALLNDVLLSLDAFVSKSRELTSQSA